MGRQSKIGILPEEVRRWLDAVLAEGNFSGYESLADALRERGYSVSKSGLHRYGQKLERRLSAIRASTEAARAIAEAAPDAADNRSAAVIALVQSELFEVLLAVEESTDAPPEERVKLLSTAARSIAELSRASVNQKRHEAEIREQARREAADAAEKVAKQGGLSADSVQELRRAILGVRS
jgi:hypothetical protein